MDSTPFWNWVNERHAIYIRKWIREGGFESNNLINFDAWPHAPEGCDLEEADPEHFALQASGPLTTDPILRQYRFCNVFRELDRVTVWIDKNIRRRFHNHPDLWIMLAIARTINWPETLEALIEDDSSASLDAAWPLDELFFTPARMAEVMQHQADIGKKVYTGAYMIRAESNPKADWYSWSKHEYIAKVVIGRLWEDREKWRAILQNQSTSCDGWQCEECQDDPGCHGLTMEAVWTLLQDKRYIGWGPFMAYQVVVDLRWTPILGNAPDINTWSALGPGSRRGLNRLAGRPVDFALTQAQGLDEMLTLHGEQAQHRAPWVPPIDLSDIQNCLCETDKYLRVKQGEGRPRAQYIPGRGS